MKPICKQSARCLLVLAAFASFALPASAGVLTLAAAGITTSLDQCESQVCGPFGPLASYSGNLSGFSGTQTVGEGAFATAAGFPFPILTSEVPLGEGANAIINAELTYQLEVVPVGGDTTPAPVLLGVSAVGSTSANTVANVLPGLQNGAITVVQLELLGLGGSAVFNDQARLVYNALAGAGGTCTTTNTSSTLGTGFVSASPGCSSSSGSGGFTETGSYSISTNFAYEVAMIANIQIGTTNNGLAEGPGSVQATAFVDPIFTVPAGFILELSAGVGDTPSPGATTPEPGTWSLFAAGLGLLGVAKRRSLSRAIRAFAPAR